MTDPFAGITQALDSARLAWAEATVPGAGVDGLTGAGLVELNRAMSVLGRQVDAVRSQVAAQIARASRAELGNAGLAQQQGFRTPAALIAATTGGSTGAAVRLVSVGEATAPRLTMTGEEAPAKHPIVAEALSAGTLSVDAAAAIIALLDKVALRAGHDAIAEAERTLTAQAVGLRLEELHKILQRAQAWLDPDGVEPREDDLHAAEFLNLHEDRSGMLVLNGKLAPESAASVKTALDAIVGTALRRRDDRRTSGMDGSSADAPGAPSAAEAHASAMPGDDDRRTVPQLRADALAVLCRHVLGCEDADAPTAGATVVVRVDLAQLESGRGHATIDGLAQPVSIATARRMAADGAVIPLVLGADCEALDFGRAKRLFTPAQKLVLTERDGGCAGCGLPPGMTQVHHVRWWARDAGPTDLCNGVLLCVRCHHRIHDDGWEIRIEGTGMRAKVWFIPPAHVDPARTPRLGGRSRFDYRPAA